MPGGGIISKGVEGGGRAFGSTLDHLQQISFVQDLVAWFLCFGGGGKTGRVGAFSWQFDGRGNRGAKRGKAGQVRGGEQALQVTRHRRRGRKPGGPGEHPEHEKGRRS